MTLSPKVALLEAPMRGLYAVQDVRNREMALSVPIGAMLNIEHAETDPHIGHVLSRMQHVEELHVLAAYLVYLRRTDSSSARWWAGYISSLPARVDTPLFYSKDELDELQASPVRAMVESRRRDIMAVR